jgi:Tol biopolymer transport system component
MAFLWDSGGHGNIWVKNLASGELRQITNERDAATIVGVPVWSPDGSSIAYWRNDGYWAIAPDGSNLRNLVQQASWATWSHDSRWLYYSEEPRRSMQIDKVPSEGGDPVPVRRDGGMGPMLSPDAKTLYYVVPLERVNGTLDYEIRSAQPENAPSKLLARIAADRIPIWQGLHPVISHDGKWLALPLNDNYGTNLWLLSTADGSLRRVVDFGNRRTFVARRFAWSSDDRFLYAAVGEGDADIVSLTGVVSPAQ